MNDASPQARRDGFTLIELLVVVAIIAVLISILLPSLSRAREQAKTVKCAAQLRAIGLGVMNYAGEHRNYTCSGSFDPQVDSKGRDGPLDEVGWVADQVNGKYSFPGQALCPSNPSRYNQNLAHTSAAENARPEEDIRELVENGYNTNYTQAWYMARTEWNPASKNPNWKRVDSCRGPLQIGRWFKVNESRVPLIGDGRTDLDNRVLGERAVKSMTDGPYAGPFDTQDYSDIGPAHGFASTFNLKRHRRIRANILFLDGHVELFEDRDRDGEFALVDEDMIADQADLDPVDIFDGVLSLGRRSKHPGLLE